MRLRYVKLDSESSAEGRPRRDGRRGRRSGPDRRLSRKTRLAAMAATLLHSVATGNLLPASTRVVSVDIQQSAVTKLMDRGTFQTIGIVTDVQPFLRSLLLDLKIR